MIIPEGQVIRMSYAKYPKEMKEAVIARMLQGDETVTDIQRDTGIGINTLYRWRDKALNQNGLSATTKYKNADKWSSQDKFTVVMETANLSEIEFSEYCREKGIYPEQVKEWKEACINANDNAREALASNSFFQLRRRFGWMSFSTARTFNSFSPLSNWRTRFVLNSALKFLLDLDIIRTFFLVLVIVYQIH